MFRRISCLFALPVMLMIGVPAHAQETPASACATIINSVPYTITTPGTYCLRNDSVTPSFYGVQIQSSDVVLNCRWKTIQASVRERGSDGISVAGTLENVTVKNCVVKDFDRGITVHGSNMQVLNSRVDNSITEGITAWGNNARVVNNRVTNTHNEPGQQAVGITLLPASPEVAATGQEAINNVVAGVRDGYLLVGMMISGSTDPRIVNNHIVDVVPAEGSYAIGMWMTGWAQGAVTTGGQMINNTVTSRHPGLQAIWGQPALCRGNTTVGLTFGFAGCLSGSDNIAIP